MHKMRGYCVYDMVCNGNDCCHNWLRVSSRCNSKRLRSKSFRTCDISIVQTPYAQPWPVMPICQPTGIHAYTYARIPSSCCFSMRRRCSLNICCKLLLVASNCSTPCHHIIIWYTKVIYGMREWMSYTSIVKRRRLLVSSSIVTSCVIPELIINNQ